MHFSGAASADQRFSEQHQFESDASFHHEQSPSLAPWSMLASRVAKIIKHQPVLAARLLCASRAAFHATAIYLLHNLDKDAAVVSDELMALSLRDMLISCFESGHICFAALKRCPAKVQPVQFYFELNQLLGSSLAHDILSENAITPELIFFAENVQTLDPLVWHARHALRLEISNAKQFDSMLRFCRRLGVLKEDQLEALVLRNTAKFGVGRYISKRFERCVSPWNFDLPAPLTHIKTAKRLIEIASKYGNCLGRVHYRVQLGLGSHAYIMVADDCVVELRHEHAGLWSIIDCERLTQNRRTSSQQRTEICNLLRQAGINAQAAEFNELWLEMEHFRSAKPLDLYGD